MAVAKLAGDVAVAVLVCKSDITYSRPINAHLVSKLANRTGKICLMKGGCRIRFCHWDSSTVLYSTQDGCWNEFF